MSHRTSLFSVFAIALSGFGAIFNTASCGNVCAPGAQQSCACPGGTEGVQACEDGTHWNSCNCSTSSIGGAGTGTNSGGANSVGGSGGDVSTSTTTSTGAMVVCGDGVCNGAENCATCTADCGCTGVDVCDNGLCGTPCGGQTCPPCQSCGGTQCVADQAKNGTNCPGGTCQGGTCVPCQPECAGKCGNAPDGCGGVCNGLCTSGCCLNTTCTTGNTDSACGNSGGTCAQCSGANHCLSGACVCNPDCTGKCGGAFDGCTGSCNQSCPSSNQYCSNQACVICSYQSTLVTADYSSGGGQPICIQQASLDASGNIAITAKKCDGSTFGAGDYYVFVFDPNDGIGTNHCQNFNAQKAHINLTGSSTPLIAFPVFASSLTCGGPEKGYCVTKAGSNSITTWFGSQNMVRANYK